MEHIISPWSVYLIGVLPSIKAVAGFITVILIFTILMAICFRQCNGIDKWDTEEEANFKRETNQVLLQTIKWSFIAIIVSGAIFVLTPDRETMIAMVVANIVTIDNINTTNEFVKTNVQDYINMIVDAVNKVK